MSTSPATGGSAALARCCLQATCTMPPERRSCWANTAGCGATRRARTSTSSRPRGLAERMTDENAKLRVLANLGRFAMLGDENERAVALGRPALALAEKLGRDEMRAHVLNNIGVARVALGEREGLDDLEASLEIARGVGGPEYVRACGNLASVLACEGQLQRSAELHREGLQISQEIGYEEPTRWLLTEIASDHMLAGNWEEARRIVDELMPGYEESPFWIEPQTRVCRARMLIAEGAVEDAVVDADRAVAVVRGKIDVPGSLQPARLPRTTPCRARGDERGSASHGRAPGRLEGDAVGVCRKLGARSLVRGLVGRGGGALERRPSASLRLPSRGSTSSARSSSGTSTRPPPSWSRWLPSRPPPWPGCGRASGWSKKGVTRTPLCSSSARFLSGVRSARGGIYTGASRCSLPPPRARRECGGPWATGLALAEKLGRDEMRAHVLNNIGVARVALGEREGLDDLEASLEIARGVGGPEYVRACGNLASVLACEGQLQRSAELHAEGLQISQEIGYEEPTRWLLTEIANDHMLAGNWAEARRIVDELMPAYEESPFWVEPQTRVCRARMLIAEGAVEAAVVDADRAVAVVEGKSTFQGLCNPLALRARLHAELGETKDAARVTAELLDVWKETRSSYVESWVLDLWFAAWSAGEEARVKTAVGGVSGCRPLARRRQRVHRAGLRQGRRPAGVDGCHLGRRHGQAVGGRVAGRRRASRGSRCAARARASFLAFGRRVAVSTQVRGVARCRLLEPPVVRRIRTRMGHVPPRGPRDRSASARLRGRGARVASRLSGCCRPPGRPDATEAHAWSRGRVLRGAARRDRCRRTCGRIPPGLSECARQSVPCADFAAVRS